MAVKGLTALAEDQHLAPSFHTGQLIAPVTAGPVGPMQCPPLASVSTVLTVINHTHRRTDVHVIIHKDAKQPLDESG